jgi:hypothetical protein
LRLSTLESLVTVFKRCRLFELCSVDASSPVLSALHCLVWNELLLLLT